MFKFSFLNRSCLSNAGNDPAAGSAKYRSKLSGNGGTRNYRNETVYKQVTLAFIVS